MPKYALLGATGATGSSVLRCLLSEPPEQLTLSILIRNRSKLSTIFPNLDEQARFPLKIIKGTAVNRNALAQCVSGADVIINCIGTNESVPNSSTTYDNAVALVETLKELQNTADYRKPTVLFLRTVQLNPEMRLYTPAPVRFMLHFCLHFAYEDLQNASDLYARAALEDPSLFEYIYIDSGALHDADGRERTGHKLCCGEDPGPGITYADLGAGICELVERRDEFKSMGVAVGAKGKVNTTWSVITGYLMRGVRNRMLHAMWLI